MYINYETTLQHIKASLSLTELDLVPEQYGLTRMSTIPHMKNHEHTHNP